MLSNYIKTSLRNFRRRRAYTFINIAGLAVGTASFLMLMQYSWFEEHFDEFHVNRDRIYRIIFERSKGTDPISRYPFVAPGMGLTITEEFQEVEAMTRFKQEFGTIVKNEEAVFEEDKVFYVDSSFFKIFSFPLMLGNPALAFREPFSVAITESAAMKFFGSTNVLNKELEVTNHGTKQLCKVTAVVENPPKNSSLDFEVLVSFNTIHKGDKNFHQTWDFYAFPTYILLSPAANYKKLEAMLPPYVAKYKTDPAEAGNEWKFYFQALSDVHLYSDFSSLGANVDSKARTINLLKIISLLIIVISWVNYINLSTARSTERAKEVGVRKAIGAYRHQVMGQFMVESALVNIIAGLLALVIISLSLPGFNQIIGTKVGFDVFQMPSFWFSFFAIVGVSILLSGIYPSLVLSSYKPLAVLKSKVSGSSGSIVLRRVLVGLQFMISAVLITSTIIIISQNNYMKEKDLGVDIKNILVLEKPPLKNNEAYISTIESFKKELAKKGNISAVSSSFSVPAKGTWQLNVRNFTDEVEKQHMHSVVGVDYDYLSIYKLPLLQGRWFSREFENDRNAMVISRKALKLLGVHAPEDAIGLQLNVETFGERKFEVIGVVEDYHHHSLKHDLASMLYMMNGQGLFRVPNFFSLKLATNGNVPAALEEAKASFAQFFPEDPFRYFFLDEEFNMQYVEEDQNQHVFSVFAILAIVLACLGVLGLSAFMAFLKTREIAIRKVLGAELQHIGVLLSKEFIYLIIVAQLIATPVIWYFMNAWLSNYPYRISIQWWFFLVAMGILLGISLLVISFNVWKAARKKPISSLG